MSRSIIAVTALLALGLGVMDADRGVAEPTAEIQRHLHGDMRKLVFSDRPVTAGLKTVFERADGTQTNLHAFRGTYILLNFWATWCAPCREEMPALNMLEQEFTTERFRVIAVASGRNPLEDIREFYRENDVTALEIFRSADSKLARDFAVLGLPMTILLDLEGQEIARMFGAADWYSDAARGLISELMVIDNSFR